MLTTRALMTRRAMKSSPSCSRVGRVTRKRQRRYFVSPWTRLARLTVLPATQEPPKEWAPTQAAPNPILNNPYEEPARHWSYVGGVPSETPGRRPASYWFKTQKIGTTQENLFAEEERDE